MPTEAQRMTLMHDLYANVDFRYPLASGAGQYDFNTGNVKTVFRGREPVHVVYPAMKVTFLPTTQRIGGGINSYYGTVSGVNIYAHGELEPVTITVYEHQQCKGDSGTGYHGKILADDLIRRTEKHVKTYWPMLLSNMEASLRKGMGFIKTDISDFLDGTERQGFELTFYIVGTNKWDHQIIGEDVDTYFTDAVVSGIDQPSLDAGEPYNKYSTISGITNLVI